MPEEDKLTIDEVIEVVKVIAEIRRSHITILSPDGQQYLVQPDGEVLSAI